MIEAPYGSWSSPLSPDQAIDGAAEWVDGNQRGDAWRAFVRRGQLTQHAAYLASFDGEV